MSARWRFKASARNPQSHGRDRRRQPLTRDQLTWRTLYGGNNMPAYGTSLRPNETEALVDFMLARRGR